MTSNSTIFIPQARAARKGLPWWVLPAIGLLAVAVVVVLRFGVWGRGGAPVVTGQFFVVLPTAIEVKIVKDGELQAAKYVDIDNKVEGITQIVWLEKEGTTVEKGGPLVKLDSSNLQQKKEQIDFDVKRAETNLKNAKEIKEIQESQNATLREAVQVSLELAQLDLKRYQEGQYPQDVANATTARDMARIQLKNKEEDLDQTRALFGKGFVTAADVKKSELEVTQARNDVRKTETALLVLENYTYPMELARLKSAVAQAEQKLARVIKENASIMAQKMADLDEKEAVLALYRRHAAKLQDQIDHCTICAPEEGLVIYMSSIDRARGLLQEGANVYNNQILMRLPDVRNMKVALKVQETQKLKLDVSKNQRATVKILGVAQPIGATLTKVAPLPDNSQRYWNPDLKEYPIELLLDETPSGVKPGMRCDVEIFIDRCENVLAVPVSTVYMSGDKSYVFVRDGDGVKHRLVTLGMSNETHVQIVKGVEEKEQVLMLQAGQGRTLLENAGIATDEPTSRPARPRARTKPRRV